MLSEIAKKQGLKTEWVMFQECNIFPDFPEFEICRRIEALEEKIKEITDNPKR